MVGCRDCVVFRGVPPTFNQVVQGSSPCQPTNNIKYLQEIGAAFSKHLCQIVPIPIFPEVRTKRVPSLTNTFLL